jgi:stigma-specific protein Stig1
MRLPVLSVAAAVCALAVMAPAAGWAQLPSPSPCCDKQCLPDGSSVKCGPPAILEDQDGGGGPEVISGCLDASPLACDAGTALSADQQTLTAGCACLLSTDLCFIINIPPGSDQPQPGPAASPEQCTQSAIAACQSAGNVVVTPNDPDCPQPGVCDPGCTDGHVCMEGSCVCPSGQTECGGACVDTSSDEANCGSCGHACASGETCESGVCTTPGPTCGDGQCDSGETPANCSQDCGACGNGVCDPGEMCPQDCGHETNCSDGVDDDGDGKVDCDDEDCRGKNRSGGGDDTNPGGHGNDQGFCNPAGVRKGL